MYLGSFAIDDYVGIPADCHRFSTGAAYAPTAITFSIYEDAGTAGIDEDVDMTPASPFDGIVGHYWYRRQLTAAAGFEAGKNYHVVVKATVDGVAGIASHTFQIQAKVNAVSVGGTAPVTPDAAGTLAGLIGAKSGIPKLDAATGIVITGFGGAGVTLGTVTTLTNAPPDSTGVATLLARIGAWTGTGINTILGAFRAALAKAAALTPTDISTATTYDNTTDSLEAIHDSESTTPPTAAVIADAVWDELSTGHTGTGKAGEQLWTDVDAIGAKTTLIGTAGATVTTPILTDGALLVIVQGDDYNNTEGRRLEWTCSDGTWPDDLTSSVITLRIYDGTDLMLTAAGTAVTPIGATQKVGVELTATLTGACTVSDQDAGVRYSVTAVLPVALGSRVITLAEGDAVIQDAGRTAT